MSASASEPSEPVLLRQSACWRYLGISERGWYRLRDSAGFPPPVALPGTKRRFWRRKDLDLWVASRGRDRRKIARPGEGSR